MKADEPPPAVGLEHMHWRDLRASDDRWLGLELEVVRRPAPPAWRVEYATPGCVRLVCAGHSLLWARVMPQWEGVWWLSAPEGPRALGPLSAREVDAVSAPPGSDAWYAAWSRYFAQALASSPRSPLHEGRWRVLRGVVDPPRSGNHASDGIAWATVHDAGSYASQPPGGFVPWGGGYTHRLIGLKPPTVLSPSRLKVWRKRARVGGLPPVLALFISSLDSYVVLDGHHRWLAAIEEQQTVPILTLWCALTQTYPPLVSNRAVVERLFEARDSGPRARKPIGVSTLNALALEAWGGGTYVGPRTRAWPIEGRVARWESEVRARLSQLGREAGPELVEGLLRAAAR
ncbi:hypothetical protein P2318_19210 [Myxococcaceae bacterium GXIMD 01537]